MRYTQGGRLSSPEDHDRRVGTPLLIWSAITDLKTMLFLIVGFAFLLRLVPRIAFGEMSMDGGPEAAGSFHGYGFYWTLANNFLDGRGFCADASDLGWFVIEGVATHILGWVCAYVTPGYPLFLALTSQAGPSFLWQIIPQALLSTGTVLCAYWLGRTLFDVPAGLIASALVAIYPYYVWHDTSLQDTGIHTFLITLSVLLILRSRRSESVVLPALAGMSLGMGILVKGTLVPFTLLALVWLLMLGASTFRARLRKTATVSAMVLLVLSPWIGRNWVLLGSPVITTQGGLYLWQANHHETSFLCFPQQDMDCSLSQAWASLSDTEIEELRGLSGDEVAQGRWFTNKGLEYLKSQPFLAVERAIRKNLIAFSWKFYPETTRLVQAIYFVSYVPMFTLGIFGMIRARRHWRDHSLIYALFLAFVVVTTLFKGYVSYRSHLDVYLMVFAASIARTYLIPSGKSSAADRFVGMA